MSAVKPSLETTVNAFVGALDGQVLPRSGARLTASHDLHNEAVGNAMLPHVAFNTGLSVTSSDQEQWTQRHAVTLTGGLKVLRIAGRTEHETLRLVLDDLHALTFRLRGLPVLADGTLYLYDERAAGLFASGALTDLVDRGGPHLTQAALTVISPPYGEARLTWQWTFDADYDPRTFGKVAVAVVGLQPSAPTNPAYSPDWTGAALPVSGDSTGWGRFNDAPPDLTMGGTLAAPTLLDPLTGGSQSVAGPDPDDLVRSVTALPYAVALAALATSQARAVGVYESGRAWNVAQLASWSTSDAGVATVDASGLIAGVAAGTCTVTATLHGITSNGITVTVS